MTTGCFLGHFPPREQKGLDPTLWCHRWPLGHVYPQGTAVSLGRYDEARVEGSDQARFLRQPIKQALLGQQLGRAAALYQLPLVHDQHPAGVERNEPLLPAQSALVTLTPKAQRVCPGRVWPSLRFPDANKQGGGFCGARVLGLLPPLPSWHQFRLLHTR